MPFKFTIVTLFNFLPVPTDIVFGGTLVPLALEDELMEILVHLVCHDGSSCKRKLDATIPLKFAQIL